MARRRLDIDRVRARTGGDQGFTFMGVFNGQRIAVATQPDIKHFDAAIGDAAWNNPPGNCDIITHAQPA